jgi:hemolysin activation/secretion protein
MPEGMTVVVSQFRISGAESYPTEQLTELVKPWVGRRLDIAGLNEAAGAITRHYQGAGHLLSYAYLPAQRVSDGVIEIAVLEGRLEAVQIVTAQDVRLRDEVVQAHTDGLTNKPPLLQADVERRLLLLNDIAGVAARAAFTPGSSTGAAEMVVSVAEDEPMVFSADVNNHGSRSTGLYRAGVSLQFRDLFGWGDNTQARAMISNKGSLVSGSLGTSLPLGGDSWRVGASLSRLSYELAGSFRNLGASGSANTFGLDASYALMRTADANLNAKAAYEHKSLFDNMLVRPGVTDPANAKRNDVFDFTLSFDRRDSWGGLTAGSLVASSGNLQILNDELRAVDADGTPANASGPAIPGLVTDRSYRKANLQLLRQQAITGPWSAYLRLSGQLTGGNLDSSEKLGLGGPGAVRAYAPGEASVDQGILGSLELRYSQDYLGGNLVWSVFHDRGQGLINRRPVTAAAGNDPQLSGSGLAVQWNGGDVGLSASMAWRGSRVATTDGDSKPRLYLQLTVTP